MSEYKHKPDTGSLHQNIHKSKDTQPDYLGQYATPDGTIREFAAWINGNYLSVKFQDQYVASDRKAS